MRGPARSLGGAGAVDAGSGDDLEVLVEPEMRQDETCGRLRFGGGHGEPDVGRAQVGQQWANPVEEAVHRPAPGGVVGTVGRDRGIGVLAQPHRDKGVVHRRADDPAGQVALGHGSANLAERVSKAGHDAVSGVGEGAVEVEDHQLRLWGGR